MSKKDNWKKYIRNYMITRYRNDPKFRRRIIDKTIECQNKRRNGWIENGLCSQCGGEREDKKWKTCERCRISRR